MMSAPWTRLELDLLPGRYAIARFDAGAAVPAWAHTSAFSSVTRTPAELSVVCDESALPLDLDAERGFHCLGLRGPLEFSEIGILAALTGILAKAEISVFAISTYDTDYLLVAEASLDAAVRTLTESGHTVHR